MFLNLALSGLDGESYDEKALRSAIKGLFGKNEASTFEDVLTKVVYSLSDLDALKPSENLEKSRLSLKEGRRLDSLFYLIEAYAESKRAQFKTHTPVDILENAIFNQRHAFLVGLFPERKPIQAPVIAAANPFINTSILWQTATFLKKGCSPVAWDQVYSFYDQGSKNVSLAESAIKQDGLFQGFQLAAIKYYQDALNEIKHPTDHPPSPETQAAQNANVSLIQDLQAQDQNILQVKAPLKGVDKPW